MSNKFLTVEPIALLPLDLSPSRLLIGSSLSAGYSVLIPMTNAFLIAAALAILTSVSRAQEPSNQQLLDRINQQQAEIDQLKAQLREVRQQSPPGVAETIEQVRVDAARHSQPVDLETFTAGYRANSGFALRSEGGDFLLHPFLLLQFRNVTTYRENGTSGGGSDTENGFEIRRLKLGADGNLFSPQFTYQMIGSIDRHNGNFSLEDAWGKYQFSGSPLYVRAGQIRDPLDHEQILFAPFLLASERSLVDSIFANIDGLVQGVSLGYDNNGPLRAELAFTDGLRSANTSFQDFPTTGINSNWGVAGRVEWKLSGDWKQYSDFSALGASHPLLVLGAGADYTEAGDTRQITHVVDAQYANPSGLSAFVAYLGRYVANDGGPPGTNGGSVAPGRSPDTYDATVRAQVGYVIDQRWEPFVRYEFIHFDKSDLIAGGHHSINEITGGVNWYLQGRRARFTLDGSYLPNGSPISDDGSGVLPETKGNEFVLRAQFQLIL